MEFEERKPASEQDITLAATEHVTIQPFHTDIAVENADMAVNTAPKRLDFDSESTTAAANLTAPLDKHPHRLTAAVVAAICMIVFAGTVTALYLNR